MVRFLISTTEELQKELKSSAEKQGQTLCGLIRQILWEWVKREGQGHQARMGQEEGEEVG